MISKRLVILVICTLLAPVSLLAQDAAALYRRHCASCHEASTQTRAPARDTLRQLTPERIMDALESIVGVMSSQGLARTPQERRALALYLSGKPFGTEKPLDASRVGCRESGNFTDPLSAPNWNGWSTSPSNTRFQNAAAAGLDLSRVRQLKLKWAFAYPGDIMAYSQATVAGGRVFVGSAGRQVYSLDAATGCVHWVSGVDAGVRAAITIGPLNNSRYAAYVGDLSANVYALDATTGKVLWKTSVEKHPAARITGAPTLAGGRLYVPVASLEEASSSEPGYECCTFRGSVVALDAATGKQLWKTYIIPQQPREVGKNKIGVRQWAPSGGGVWASPTLDVNRKVLYVATGDSYSAPAAKTTDAIVAMNMDSGQMLWVRQLTGNDAWNVACIRPDKTNCPEGAGPDFDFG